MMAYDSQGSANDLDVLIIGTGFSGLCMGVKLLEAGMKSFLILERAGEVGGTWRDNHYPGCACDIQSHLYSFSFEQNPKWTRMFAPQPEIKAYLQHCAEKYGLLPHIRFGADVASARYEESEAQWHVTTRDGRSFRARALVAGIGGLAIPAIPSIEGLETFEGKRFHSAQWDHQYDFTGKHVAVIGTGASAIQFVPKIAERAAQLDLYQRTPPWILPKPDREISPFERKLFRWLPLTQHLFRSAIYWLLEMRVIAFTVRPKLARQAQTLAWRHIARFIKDPELRRKLTPDYMIGCKRILMSNDYYPALAQPNVEVVTDGIREVRPRSIVTADGREREVDAIVFGTGFKAQDPIPRGLFFGRNGLDIVDAFKDGMEAYLGTTVHGFPNFFILMGPNTGLGHNSMVYMIESQVHYAMECLRAMRTHRLRAVDVRPEVQSRFNGWLQKRLVHTVWSSGCRSWYLNANGKNTTLWPGFTFTFRRLTRRFRKTDYVFEAEKGSVRV
jgi:cation diffusion facilitator CzcD-associated flavoprotein CzcO